MNTGDVVAFQVEGGVECSWKSAGINPLLWRVKVMNSGLQACADGNLVEAGPRPSLAVLLLMVTMMLCYGLWQN